MVQECEKREKLIIAIECRALGSYCDFCLWDFFCQNFWILWWNGTVVLGRKEYLTMVKQIGVSLTPLIVQFQKRKTNTESFSQSKLEYSTSTFRLADTHVMSPMRHNLGVSGFSLPCPYVLSRFDGSPIRTSTYLDPNQKNED